MQPVLPGTSRRQGGKKKLTSENTLVSADFGDAGCRNMLQAVVIAGRY
jgi:hypothetical protein